MIFLDTETCGLHGMAVLLQYAEDDGEIQLYNLWTNPIIDTLRLIEWICEQDVIMFNSSFDWFHLTKLYNVFSRHPDYDAFPVDHIDEIAELEEPTDHELCLKPKGTLDLMLHARKGPFQSTMDREDIRIKKVPSLLAHKLSDILNERIRLPDIYFERSASKRQWRVLDHTEEGEILEDFKDVVLKFAPSSALKALAVHALKYDNVKKFKDVEVDKKFRPNETGFAPFALAGYKNNKGRWVKPYKKNGKWKWIGTWPDVINEHIIHWSYNTRAREYAKDDVVYTRDLYHYFNKPELDDDDSVLACMVGAIRWHGFKIDVEQIKTLKVEAQRIADSVPFKWAPHKVKQYLYETMEEVEQLVVTNTKKTTLEEIAMWDGHPAADRANEVLKARTASKEVELYDKLLTAGRFHASFKVIGTLSTRMAGADGLNPQGIKRATTVRSAFPLAFGNDDQLDGGDYDAFEISLMDAAYQDPKMHRELLSGKKIHAIWGERYFFPHMIYDEICLTKGQEPDYYTRSKNGVFAICYFGEGYTLITRVPVFAKKRRYVIDLFCSMSQPNGIGTRVVWAEPSDYIESMFGFKRYFTLENKIVKVLFDLAQNPPNDWKGLNLKVTRRDREQTVSGATQSALYGAAFAQQSANMRAAGNHVIQSSGAQITKRTQRRIWDLQPYGVKTFYVILFNVHDEIMSVNKKSIVDKVQKIVEETVESYRDKVPLIKMEWKQNLKSWGEK